MGSLSLSLSLSLSVSVSLSVSLSLSLSLPVQCIWLFPKRQVSVLRLAVIFNMNPAIYSPLTVFDIGKQSSACFTANEMEIPTNCNKNELEWNLPVLGFLFSLPVMCFRLKGILINALWFCCNTRPQNQSVETTAVYFWCWRGFVQPMPRAAFVLLI